MGSPESLKKTWKVPRFCSSALIRNGQLPPSPGCTTKVSVKLNRPVSGFLASAIAGPADSVTNANVAAATAQQRTFMHHTPNQLALRPEHDRDKTGCQ